MNNVLLVQIEQNWLCRRKKRQCRTESQNTSLTTSFSAPPPLFSSCSEEQDLVPGQRLHHDPEDSEDVALQEEAQTSVGVVTEAQIIPIYANNVIN